jgi:GNAT superfamily N-acetyltransferase
MKIDYIPYESKYRDVVYAMIKSLYAEDTEVKIMNDSNIDRTIEFLLSNPGNGRITLIANGEIIIGYSILIYFWSNEYGGRVLLLDEFYINEEFRSQGIGTTFLEQLKATEASECKAIILEVVPSNFKAQKFYDKMGFRPVRNKYLRYILNDKK